ncbi:hypothetical protein PAECIP111891_07052 [Paenibacillus allorhizoplanae]|uniref:Uncharacterized protein n=1 Tax=Paenibacillus allorhizoplanae TaxID=2905648 RepID=A0ABM9CZG0_9BACL|nr:hypothetical protein PAECIP111891_07052 [Paenibacillus allorhizoplanae]
MGIEKSKFIKVTIFVLFLSCFSVLISFILSFIIGSAIFSNKFSNPYIGAVLYYFWCALPIVLIMPSMFYQRLKVGRIGRIFIISIVSGTLFSFFSLIVIHLYLDNMENFPLIQTSRVGYAVKFDNLSLYFLGVLFSASILLIGLFSRFKYRKV